MPLLIVLHADFPRAIVLRAYIVVCLIQQCRVSVPLGHHLLLQALDTSLQISNYLFMIVLLGFQFLQKEYNIVQQKPENNPLVWGIDTSTGKLI